MSALTTTNLLQLRGWRAGHYDTGVLTDCNLVVPTYCRPKVVVQLLTQLTRLPDRPAEVIVVDGSPDRLTAELLETWVARHSLPFVLLYVASPPGLTRQRNVGLDASSGEYVFYLDDDCLPQPGYFQAIQRVFARDLAGRVGAVCGSLINEMNKPLSRRWRVRLALGLAPRQGESGLYYPTATSVPRALAKPFTGTRITQILPGAAFACRRSALQRHRFSMFFDGYSQGEDLEFSMRLGREYQLLWCGEARAIHQQDSAGRPGGLAKGRMEIRNRYFIWQRHTPNPSLGCRVQLWLDFGFVFAWDLLSALVHPRQRGFVAHAAGVARGMFDCLVDPPRHDEPPAQREYQFAWENRAEDLPQSR